VSTSPFTVRLDRVFQGPMDLLLHLVREQEVEISEVSISRVITGYLEYLSAMRDLDIEVAGDFLVMAATLMSIKSRSLLPRDSVDLEDDLDPKDELIQRLLEYRRFREASDRLGECYELRAMQHPRGAKPVEVAGAEPELDLGEVSSWDLLAAFSRLMRETLANRPHRVITDPRPLRFYVAELARRIRMSSTMSLRALVFELDTEPTRESLIGSFCALLELTKLGIIRVVQDERKGDISLVLNLEHVDDMEVVIQSSVFDDEKPPESAVTPENGAVTVSESTQSADGAAESAFEAETETEEASA
jgi:segregation and condensation protein A